MAETQLVTIRQLTEADLGYVIKSWLQTYRHESRWARCMPNGIYYPNHRTIVTNLVERETTLVACDPADPSHLVGFACGAKLNSGIALVHFVYVKHRFRGWGIAKALLSVFGWSAEQPIIATHATFLSDRLAQTHRVVFNPYLLGKWMAEENLQESDDEEVSQDGSVRVGRDDPLQGAKPPQSQRGQKRV